MSTSFSHSLFDSLNEKETAIQAMTVSELTGIIKELVEGSFPVVCIEGEISNFKPSSTGHLYFTLKDNTAAISAVMFRGKSRYMSFTPRDGITVKVKGSISVYPPRGSYQIVIDSMEQSGSGDILQMLEERKRRLAAEGLFDTGKKKDLPFFPSTIGVVSSPTGAALRDIVQIVKRRNNTISIVILPCPVQGDDAPEAIIKQIQNANNFNLCDVLIVGRGGGSLEDLLPFSDEGVVRAVANSKIPIVSAVGHEIDWAICDYAADIRAPTPSAAAELATPLKDELLEQLSSYSNDLLLAIKSKIEKARLLVKSFSIDTFELKFRSIEQPYLMRFDDAKEQLIESINDRIIDARQNINDCIKILDAANPHSILERGYSMVRDLTTGTIIKDSSSIKNGQILDICPAHGRIHAVVNETLGWKNENI